MKSLFVLFPLVIIATADVSHLRQVSNQYLPPNRGQQFPPSGGYIPPVQSLRPSGGYIPPQQPQIPTGGYIPPLQPQRPGTEYLPSLQQQSQTFPSAQQAPIFSPSVPIQRHGISAYRPETSYNPSLSAPIFSPTVPSNNYIPSHLGPAPGSDHIGSISTGIGESGGFDSLGQGIYTEPAPAHSFGSDGYSYRRPSGGFGF